MKNLRTYERLRTYELRIIINDAIFVRNSHVRTKFVRSYIITVVSLPFLLIFDNIKTPSETRGQVACDI